MAAGYFLRRSEASAGFTVDVKESHRDAKRAQVEDGTWHTVECIKDGNIITVVVDGRATSHQGEAGSILNHSPLTIGAKASRGGDYYEGLVDEVTLTLG